MFVIAVHGGGIAKFTDAVNALGSEARAKRAYSMALNKTITTVNARVKRAVSKQMGLAQAIVVKRGALKVVRASAGNLEAAIDATGAFIPLKDFKASQRKKGVSANPWATRRIFAKTFLDRAGTAGGHVFKNTGKFNRKSQRNNAIEALWGPSVPRELVKDESAKAFEDVSRERLPIEVARAITALTSGAVK